MKEYENDGSSMSSEQIRQNLLDYLEDAEFASIKHWAASDYFNLSHQERLLSIQRNNVLSAGRDQEKKMYWESEMRIREAHIAILERDIDRNKSRVPGYSKAYMYLVSNFYELGVLTYREAESKYPADEEKRDLYQDGIYSKVQGEISNVIFSRQDQS